MAGGFYEKNCKAFWKTGTSNRYICDERYRPGGRLYQYGPSLWRLQCFVSELSMMCI